MFFRKKKEKKSKIDKLVTGIIIWWAVASMVWLSQTKKWKEVTKEVKEKWLSLFSKWTNLFWKALIKAATLFDKKNK